MLLREPYTREDDIIHFCSQNVLVDVKQKYSHLQQKNTAVKFTPWPLSSRMGITISQKTEWCIFMASLLKAFFLQYCLLFSKPRGFLLIWDIRTNGTAPVNLLQCSQTCSSVFIAPLKQDMVQSETDIHGLRQKLGSKKAQSGTERRPVLPLQRSIKDNLGSQIKEAEIEIFSKKVLFL